MFATTPSLFGFEQVEFDSTYREMERIDLDDESWLDYCPMWLSGDQTLFAHLTENAEWSQPVVRMYYQEVLTPRLTATVPIGLHPVIPKIVDTLSQRYGMQLDRVSAGWYRDGNDSVAFHGDRVARDRPHATVATVSLGGPRRFLIRPKAGGPSRAFTLGHGDLVVMGGACQRRWEHAVPKTSQAPPRIALMFRHSYN